MCKTKYRLATADDADLLFSCFNDAEARNNSFSSGKISYQQYIDWFFNSLFDDMIEIYIYYLNDEPIGHARLTYSNEEVSISYSVAQKYRGQECGTRMIHDIERIIIEKNSEMTSILTIVKVDDIASQRIFEDKNYAQISQNHDDYIYRKKIDENKTASVMPEVSNRKRILLLTNNRNALKLYDRLSLMGESVTIYSGVLSEDQLIQMKANIVVSYNYKYIIPSRIISFMKGKIVNLHISYLPWNKGSDPNFWSFIDNTPKGVTIHKVDAHLDTGNILYQKEIRFDEDVETFRTSYNRLNDEIVSLFCDNWTYIKNDTVVPFVQKENGTYHKRSDFNTFIERYPVNWDETISQYKMKYNLQ